MSATPIALPAREPEPADSVDTDDSAVAALHKLDIFKGLPGAVINKIVDTTETREYVAGQTIYSMGQYDGADLLAVIRGRIRISIVDPNTGSMFIDELGPKNIFGIESALRGEIGDLAQRLSVTAEEASRVAAIDAETFRDLASQRPTLMRNIALHFAAELTSVRYKAMATQAAPEQRVCAYLLEHIKRDGVSGEWRIASMPKHREIAETTGVEEAEAANTIAMLIQENVAERDYPGMIIRDMSRLNQLAR